LGSFRILISFLAFGLVFDILIAIFIYVYSYLSFNLSSLQVLSFSFYILYATINYTLFYPFLFILFTYICLSLFYYSCNASHRIINIYPINSYYSTSKIAYNHQIIHKVNNIISIDIIINYSYNTFISVFNVGNSCNSTCIIVEKYNDQYTNNIEQQTTLFSIKEKLQSITAYFNNTIIHNSTIFSYIFTSYNDQYKIIINLQLLKLFILLHPIEHRHKSIYLFRHIYQLFIHTSTSFIM